MEDTDDLDFLVCNSVEVEIRSDDHTTCAGAQIVAGFSGKRVVQKQPPTLMEGVDQLHGRLRTTFREVVADLLQIGFCLR